MLQRGASATAINHSVVRSCIGRAVMCQACCWWAKCMLPVKSVTVGFQSPEAGFLYKPLEIVLYLSQSGLWSKTQS